TGVVAIGIGDAKVILEVGHAGRRKLTGINGGILAGAEGLDLFADIGQRGVHFPAKAVVQSDVGFDLPAVLREQVKRSGTNLLVLGGALGVSIRQTQEIVWILIGKANIVGAASIEDVFAIDVKIEQLIEPLIAGIRTKFQTVAADNFAEVVADL